jgi:L-ascorbate metabolism protein UlaG (beta-lactamase superfamily)
MRAERHGRRRVGRILSIGTGLGAAAALAACASPAAESPAAETALSPDLPAAAGKLHWFGISSILYGGSQTVYFVPVMIEGEVPPADVVLIRHAHDDHANPEDLKRVITPQTLLIISPNAGGFSAAHEEEIGGPALVLDEGETADAGGAVVRAVPACDTVFHFRESKGMGFVVTVDGETISFAGGTRFYPEMAAYESVVTIYP